jgi:hypothetical protein
VASAWATPSSLVLLSRLPASVTQVAAGDQVPVPRPEALLFGWRRSSNTHHCRSIASITPMRGSRPGKLPSGAGGHVYLNFLESGGVADQQAGSERLQV